MKNFIKYEKQYFLPPVPCYDWAKKDAIEKAPSWCSVDLRDGNQSLIEPMDLQTKVEFFKLLVEIGFKEIEVGFPAASQTEYDFLRKLIDENLIPDDVTVQVLTQAREHIIKKTFDAVKGAKKVIIHVYNSTSVAQREQVFKKSKEEIKKIAVKGATLLKELTDKEGASYRFEYSPESFTGTEPEYALEVVNAVLEVWQPTPERKAIINLPATVENAIPHVYAQQVEYMHKFMRYRDAVEISLHPHNDRGCGVAAAELGILAGADRIEGTLFGNGERTGNVDIITLAMNMFSQGVNPNLNFKNMPYICALYKSFTNMPVSPRQPYAGELVFAAFSGSHQDAIAKGMDCRKGKEDEKWTVPYLPIDPHDVGRKYDSDVIRINSQSGKGGVGYVLQTAFGINVPNGMKEQMGYKAKDVSDNLHKELSANEVYDIFVQNYIENHTRFEIPECHFKQVSGIEATVSIFENGKSETVVAQGNGRLDAVSNAVKSYFKRDFVIIGYEQHALSQTSKAKAISYIGIESNGKTYWGAGIDEDIIKSSYKALVSAVNNLMVG
ncbi:MAG: 2-isopropylmalate synthase [Clostridiales bacterium]|nr:2-isopropylmalate synthase [Clostridiales bacterium]